MENGKWIMDNGEWIMDNGEWGMGNTVVARFLRFVIARSLLAILTKQSPHEAISVSLYLRRKQYAPTIPRNDGE